MTPVELTFQKDNAPLAPYSALGCNVTHTARAKDQMMTQTAELEGDEADFAAQRKAAFHYMNEAFAEGRLDGIEADCLAQAALFAALKEFVSTYGEEPVAAFAERLPERIRRGEFTVSRPRQ